MPGNPSLISARAQLAYLEVATDAALAGTVAGLCTAPISKDWIARAGFPFAGHTEYLAARAETTEFAMMLAGPRLRVVLATRHIALRDVPAKLTAPEIVRAAVLAAEHPAVPPPLHHLAQHRTTPHRRGRPEPPRG